MLSVAAGCDSPGIQTVALATPDAHVVAPLVIAPITDTFGCRKYRAIVRTATDAASESIYSGVATLLAPNRPTTSELVAVVTQIDKLGLPRSHPADEETHVGRRYARTGPRCALPPLR